MSPYHILMLIVGIIAIPMFIALPFVFIKMKIVEHKQRKLYEEEDRYFNGPNGSHKKSNP